MILSYRGKLLLLIILWAQCIFGYSSEIYFCEPSNAVRGDFTIRDEHNNEKIRWFTDARFGMFIHWGLYSIPAGEWKGEVMPLNKYAEQINLAMKIPNAEYEKLANEFNPVDFNADEWVDCAVKAGMKYMVITAKHQEGFAMFHSKFSDYNVVDATPFKRDPLSELAVAARKAGLKFGFYYSNARDYHVSGANWNTHGNTWDFLPQSKEDFKAYYYGLVFNQVEELLTNYGKIDIMWFDVPYKLTEQMSKDLKAHVVSLQPDCLINGRIGNNLGDYFSTRDNEMPSGRIEEAWETCVAMNGSWGYSKHHHNWKSSKQLIETLIESVSKGGNFLLNVGPTGQGSFDDNSMEILDDIGIWMKSNSSSIYNCTYAPEEFKAPEGYMLTYNAEKERLYIHLIENRSKELCLPGYRGKIMKAKWLYDSSEIRIADKSQVDDSMRVVDKDNLYLILHEKMSELNIPVIELVLTH